MYEFLPFFSSPRPPLPLHPTLLGIRHVNKHCTLYCFAGLVLTLPLNPELFGSRTGEIIGSRQPFVQRETCLTGLKRGEAVARVPISCPDSAGAELQ